MSKKTEIARFVIEEDGIRFAKVVGANDMVFAIERFANGVFLSLNQGGEVLQRNPLRTTLNLNNPVLPIKAEEINELIQADPMYRRYEDMALKNMNNNHDKRF